MGRLFWKFLFAFWLTLLTAGLSVGVVVGLHSRATGGRDAYVSEGGRATLYVKTGAGVLEAGGVPQLRAVMARWAREGPVPLYVVDPLGRELLARPVADASITEAARLAQSGGAPHPARWVQLADGSRYLLFVPAAEDRPPPFDGPSGTRPPGPPGLSGPSGPPGPGHPRPPLPWPLIAAGVLASLCFSALLAWYVAKPIRHLRRAFDAAAHGELAVRVQPQIGRRRDEIADLGRDFDRMAERLQDLIGAQRRLFHDVSHELRSPLARIQAAVGLARQRPEKFERTLSRVEREAGRLDQLVGELLLLARLESGVSGTVLEEIDLFSLVQGIVEDARWEAEASGRRVELTGTSQATLMGRTDLLARAVENVVRNALKYTAQGTSVLVNLQDDPMTRQATISVSDQGPGVAEQDLAAIFDPFFRGPNVDQSDGHGLGLAIAQRAVAAHHGTISAANRPGGGLRVDIRLPVQ